MACPSDRWLGTDNCKLIQVRLDGRDPNIILLYAPQNGELIDSPVWAPNGRHIAFLIEKDIAILDAESGEILQRVTVPKTRRASPTLSALRDRDYIRWSNDGRHIFLWAERLGPGYGGRVQDIGDLDIGSGEFRWLDLHGISFMYGTYTGRSLFENERYRRISEPLPDSPAIRALFGSSENAVLRPTWSPNYRDYFYQREREGFWAKGWIERYDMQTSKRTAIKTLWWAPYRE